VADGFISTYGCPFLHARCRTGYGAILVATGHWDEAERELSAAIRTSQDAFPPIHAYAIARLADLRVRQGRLEEADALLATVGDEIAAVPLAALSLARGDPAVAVALLQRALHLLGESQLDAAPILELLVDAQVAQGALEAAASTVECLNSLAHQHGHDVVAAHASRASGRLLLARGDGEAAVVQSEQAVERFSRLDLPLETARARLDLARALVAGQRSVAIVEGRRALAAFEQLGAARDADAAAALLRSLGDSARTGPKHVGVLTRREQEVLRLVAAGLSNPEIARRLFISRKTAAHHVSSVLAKLGLRTRAEAITYAVTLNREIADTTSIPSPLKARKKALPR
jgi:DNA-binding NarL/FixJ family response regulator